MVNEDSSLREILPDNLLYKLLVQNLPGIAIIVFDRNLRCIAAEGPALNALGYERDTLIGQSIDSISPQSVAFLKPIALNAIEGHEIEFDGQAGDYFYHARMVPVKNEANQIIAGMMVAQDATAHRKAENDVLEREEQFRLLMQNNHDGIILGDEHYHIVKVNAAACELFGYSEAEMLQMPGFKFIDIHDPSFVQFKQNMGKTFHTELVGIRSDGTRFPVDANVSTHQQSNGRAFTWAVIRDISEQKQYQQMQVEQEKLRTALEKEAELSQLKSRIMERIAHEFRTPLTVLQMTTESLTTYLDRFTPEQRNARASTIKKQNHRLTEMLDEIAIAMRGSFLPEKLSFTPVDLSALCRDVIHDLELQFDLAGKYMLDAPESACITGDHGALWNAVYHVLANAYRYSPRTEVVCVRLIERESWIDLVVTSKSVGVPDGEAKKVFEPFVRGSNIGEITGLGLGLTIAKTAVEAHQGTITLKSDLDQTTTVRISLPLNGESK